MRYINSTLAVAIVAATLTATPATSQALKFEKGAEMVIRSTLKRWKKATRRTTDSYVYQGYRGGAHVFKGRSSNGDALLLELNANGDLKRFKRGNSKMITYPRQGLSAILPNQRGSWGKWENCASSRVKRLEFETKCKGRIFGDASGQSIGTLTFQRDGTNGFWLGFEQIVRGRNTNTLMSSSTWQITKAPAVSGKVPGF